MEKLPVKNFYIFIMGLLSGMILFGILDTMGLFIPYFKKNFYDNPKLIFGYHVHHTVLGLFSIVWGLYSFFNQSKNGYFWIGFGFGTIIIHTIVDRRLVFIEKIK